MLRFINGCWANFEIDAPTVAHCAFESNGRHVFSLTPFGDVHVASPAGFTWEKVDQDPASSPNRLRQMRDLRRVGDSLFAVGMGRMAYERSSSGTWRRVDDGMRNLVGTGLLCVDGCDREHVYACGMGGEVWFFDGRAWTQIDSPTNLKLEQVLVCSPSEVILAGAKGVVIKGDGVRWKTLDATESRSTLWGAAKLGDKVYLADNAQIYVIDGDDLVPVALPFEGPLSTGRLQQKGGFFGRSGSVISSASTALDGLDWTTREPVIPRFFICRRLAEDRLP